MDIGNNLLELAIRQSIHAEAQDARPNNTQATYLPKQREFLHFCDRSFHGSADKYIVTGGKLLVFLQTEVVGRNRKSRGRKRKSMEEEVEEEAASHIIGQTGTSVESAPIPENKVSHSVVRSYVAAVKDLYAQQVKLGMNSNADPRADPSVIELLNSLATREARRRQQNYDDTGIGCENDGYNSKQKKQIVDYFWGQADLGSSLRNVCLFNCSGQFFSRGEGLQNLTISNLYLSTRNEGIDEECLTYAVRVRLRGGKTNQFGKIDYAGAKRHREVAYCAVGSIALYLFWRLQMDGEEWPDFGASQNWYDIKLFRVKKKNRTEKLGYQTHYKALKKCFQELGIVSSKVTHSGRAQIQELAKHGVGGDVCKIMGGWNKDAIYGAYFNSLPTDGLNSAAGFNKDILNPVLARDVLEVPDELLKLVFPNVCEDLSTEITKEKPNLGAVGFLELMKFLRTTVIQDAVLLKKRYPHSRLFMHPIFKSEAFNEYAAELERQIAIVKDEAPMSFKKQWPEVQGWLDNKFMDLKSSLNKDSKTVVDATNNTCRKISTLLVKSMNAGTSAFAQACQNEINALENPNLQQEEHHVPIYNMNRNITSVREVWREFNEGLDGQPAVNDLVKKYDKKWIPNGAVDKFYRRRKIIIEAINIYSTKNDISTDEAVEFFERIRGQKSLHWLTKNYQEHL